MMKATIVLDAKGLACPMPIVKTKKRMKDLKAGEVLEIHATDKGSTADLEAWAKVQAMNIWVLKQRRNTSSFSSKRRRAFIRKCIFNS